MAENTYFDFEIRDKVAYRACSPQEQNIGPEREQDSIHTPSILLNQRTKEHLRQASYTRETFEHYTILSRNLHTAARAKKDRTESLTERVRANVRRVRHSASVLSLASMILLCSGSGYSAEGKSDDVTMIPRVADCFDTSEACTVSGLPFTTILRVENWPRRDENTRKGMSGYDITVCLDRITAGRTQQMFCESSQQQFTPASLNEDNTLFSFGKNAGTVYAGNYTLRVDGTLQFEDHPEQNIHARSALFTIEGSGAVSALPSDLFPGTRETVSSFSERMLFRRGYVLKNKKRGISIPPDAQISAPEGYVFEVVRAEIPEGAKEKEALFVVHGRYEKGKIMYDPLTVTALAFDRPYTLAQSPAQQTIEAIATSAVFARKRFDTYAHEGTMYAVLVQYSETQPTEGVAQPGYNDGIDTLHAAVSVPFSVGEKRPDAALAYVSGVGTGVGLAWLLQPKDTVVTVQEPTEIEQCLPGEGEESSGIPPLLPIWGLFGSLRIPIGQKEEGKEEEPLVYDIPVTIVPEESAAELQLNRLIITEKTLRAIITAPVYPIPEVEVYGNHGRFVGPKYDKWGTFSGNYINGAPHEAPQNLIVSEDLETITYSVEKNAYDEHTMRPLIPNQFVAYLEGYDMTGKVYKKIVRLDENGSAALPDEFIESQRNGTFTGYQITVGSYFITSDERIGLLAAASTTVGRFVQIPAEYKRDDFHFINAEALKRSETISETREIPNLPSGEH